METFILLSSTYMQKPIKVKKTIEKEIQNNILRWNYIVYDDKWEYVEVIWKESKYKYKLSNDKKFMKRWIDRKISKLITQNLRDVDLWFLYKIESYMDDENIIDLKRFKIDYKYSDSKLSKSKRPLLEAWILKENNWLLYMNPLVGIIGKEISQELIEIFEDTFERYDVKVTL